MKLSARNVLKGKVIAVKRGKTTAHVKIDIGRGSVRHLVDHGRGAGRAETETRRHRLRHHQGVRRHRREMNRLNRLAALLVALIALPAAAQTLTDAAGRQVTLPAKVERVFAAGPPASIFLYTLAPDKMTGWNRAPTQEERAFIPPRYADLPVTGRLTGRGNTANVEVVLQLKPDLIFDYGTVNPTYASLADRTQTQTNIPFALIDGSFAEIENSYVLLGNMLGEQARAAKLAAYVHDTLTEISKRVAAVPVERRPRVYYARGPRGLETGLGGSINVESIEYMGATNVAAAMGRGGLANVSMEQILAWNPDVVVTLDESFQRFALSDPLWKGVGAVQGKRVHVAPSLPFGWINSPPSVNRIIGLRWLARVLYPDLFPEDLRPIAREFYALFYHQTPSEAQLDQLLGDVAALK